MSVPGGVKAGKISKPYGLQGHVNLILEPEAGKFIEIDNPLFIDIDGQRVPFFVEEFDLVSVDQAIIKFQFINTIEEARDLNGCEVHLNLVQKSPAQKEGSEFKAFVGYKVFDQDLGYLGKVIDYIQNDFNSVIIVDFEGKELLIPAVEELISHFSHYEQSIHFNLPEGLTKV